FDDLHQIEENVKIRDLSRCLSPGQVFSPRPVVELTFALNYQFGKLNVSGYHLVNVLIHVINGFLVYFLALTIFRQLFIPSAQRFGHSNSPKSKVQSPRSKVQGEDKTLPARPALRDEAGGDIGHWTSDIGLANTNLFAMEIDAENLLHDFIEDYRAIIRDAFDTWESMRENKMELRFDRNVMAMFARTAPPGMCEVFALEKLTEFINETKFDWYILDTAPTGHLLVLLEFPNLVREWLSRAYRGLVKYQVQIALTNLGELGNRILKSTQLVNKIHQILTNPGVSQLVTVTIPEAMGVEETNRLLVSVKSMGVPCSNIFVNMVTPPSDCGFCSSKRGSEERYIQKLSQKNPEYNIVRIPLFPHQIRGVKALTRLSRIIYGN
ncbi:MAG: ArsA family ATPase, partial [Pseudomonadota bacterium]